MFERGGAGLSKSGLWVLLIASAAVVVAAAGPPVGDPTRVLTWFTSAGGLITVCLAVVYLQESSDRR